MDLNPSLNNRHRKEWFDEAAVTWIKAISKFSFQAVFDRIVPVKPTPTSL
jgi:hypothetical protein